MPPDPAGRRPGRPLRDRAIGILCAVLSILLFSGFTLVSRLGLSSSLTLPDLAALRFGIGGALLLPVVFRHGLSGMRWQDAGALAVLGGLGFAVLAYAGFWLAPAAHGAVLLHGTLPLSTFAIMRGTRQPGRRYGRVGLALIAFGVALMACDSLAGASLRQLAGDGCLLLASVSWSAYGVLSRHLDVPPAQGAAVVVVISMCAFLPFYTVLAASTVRHVGLAELTLQAVVQGVLIGAVSIVVYTRAVAALGPAATALFTAAVPCVTTLAAGPLLSEYPTTLGVLGVVVVTVGMVAALQPRRRLVPAESRAVMRSAIRSGGSCP